MAGTATVHPIRLRLSNAFLVQGDAPVLVDTGSPGEAPKILRAIERRGVAPRDVRLILLTHAHTDHAGAAAELRRATGAPVALHPADAGMLRRGRMNTLRPVRPRHHLLRAIVDKPFEGLEADIELADGQRLDAWGLAASVAATPGHCPGHVAVLLDGGDKQPAEALAGDLLIGGFLGGLIDKRRPRLPYFLDDRSELLRSVDRLLATPAKRWWVGHGGPLDVERIEALRR